MENVARHGAGNRSTPAHKANLTRRTTMKKKENCIDEELDRCEYKPRMAICYDFDRTLSPDDMQTFSLIPSFGIDSNEFWSGSDALAHEHRMDKNLAWMYELIKYSKFKGKSLRREYFKEVGKDVLLYKGVESWFDHINAYAAERGIEVEHYIISSGLKEIIEGNPIAKYFKRIYASTYLYSADGIAEWPAQAVNYTNKTQFIFRISKGYLEEYDERVNDSTPDSRRRIPYENIVYIGDSATDIPCMKLVKSKGGYSIGVFDPSSNNKKRVYQLWSDGRLSFYAPANYSENSSLSRYMRQIIDVIAVQEKMKAEQRTLDAPAETYKRKMTVQKIVNANSKKMTKEERDALENMMDHFEDFTLD